VLASGAAAPEVGDEVEVEVDAELRRSLSAGHTACHLASLALNAALEAAWRKAPRADAAGRPDFDGVAIETSTIVRDGSVDVYRVGRSVRKAGFEVAALDDLAAVEAAAQSTLDAWLAAGGPVRIERDGPALTDRRRWATELDGATVRIPCGGTHAGRLEDFAGIRLRLERREVEGALAVTMTTAAAPAD
jgi:alanyl-tRNA synthetase